MSTVDMRWTDASAEWPEWASNFTAGSSPVFWRGEPYRTVEHAYQAAKTDDLNSRASIRMARTPRDAKRLGRRVSLRETWEQEKDEVMMYLLAQKFSIGGLLARELVATGKRSLCEWNSWHDNYWGVCRCERCTPRGGRNQLGRSLMLLRAVCNAEGVNP